MPKRRAHGEGALFRRNKGTSRESWVARIYFEDGSRKEAYAQTQSEARQKLEELKRGAELGLALRTPRQTVGQFLADWMENVAKPKLRPRTFAAYRTIVKNYLVPHLGYVQLTKLTPQHIQAFQNELVARSLRRGGGTISSGTVVNARRVLGRALEQATRWGLIARNPVRLVDGPHLVRREIQPLDTDQARRLLAAVRGDRLEALFTVALALGLRRREAMGLKWEDIDFTTSTLYVQRSLQRGDNGLELVDVKTKKSRRAVPLPLVAIRALQQHRQRQESERSVAIMANLWRDTGLVFTNHSGGPLDPEGASKSFQRVLQREGLPHQRFHDLRHACASLLLAQGLDLKVIQEILGHSTITITADLYAHVMMGAKRQAAAQMDAMLGTELDEDGVGDVRLAHIER
jgi:integrase